MATGTKIGLDPKKLLDPFLLPIGYPAPEMEDIELFHEQTKLKSYHEKLLGLRIGTYLTDPRAIEETAANFKYYSEAKKFRLPDAEPINSSISEVFAQRTSCRSFSGSDLSLQEVSQILTAVRANRVASTTIEDQKLWFRPFPSGGGLYPTEVYVACRHVRELGSGIFHYNPRSHELAQIVEDVPFSVMKEALGDADNLSLGAGLVVFVTMLPERSVVKYSYRGYRFALMEAGVVPMMLNVAATGIGLGCLHWGGFLDGKVNNLLRLDGISENAISCLIVGRKAND